MSAVVKVLETYELLETILEFLPTRDLLLAQAVCTQFQGVVTTSHGLQQKLHLKPEYKSRSTPSQLAPRFFQLLNGVSRDKIYSYGELRVSDVTVGGSWRLMYPFQPPPPAIVIRIPSKGGTLPLLQPPDGSSVTMGMIADTIRES